MKANEFTLEELDKAHSLVQPLTKLFMHVTVVLGMLAAIWNAGIGDDYFKGASTCPALSFGRQGLARFDANVFYYYKSSLALYCDIEDSFWRLLMDGWVRGVVSGSDSFLLLISTLPKALLFKSAVSTFLRPLYAVLYAICGMALSTLLAEIGDGGHWILKHMSIPGGAVCGGRLSKMIQNVWRFPTSLKTKLTTKSFLFGKARLFLIAVGLSSSLRLIVHLLGFTQLAALGSDEINTWQLAFEPVLFFYLAYFFGKLDTHLTKTIWKKGISNASVPLTLWRTRPSKDVVDSIIYTRTRLTRTYNHFREQAQSILHVLVDDVFNMVVVLRLVCILFSLAPALRQVAIMSGLGGVVDRHRTWFIEATGFQDADVGSKYLSDYLIRFGLYETFIGFSAIGQVVEEDAITKFFHLQHLKQMLWRLLVPFVLYRLETRWTGFLKKQQTAFKKGWKGTDWTDGAFADMLAKYGSYWVEVPKEEWVVEQKK